MKLNGKALESFLDYLRNNKKASIEIGVLRLHWQEYPKCYLNALIIEWFSTLELEGKNFYNKVFDFYYQQRLDSMTINDIHKQAIEKANLIVMSNLIEILPNIYGVKVPKYYIQGQVQKWYNEYFLKYAYKNEKFDTFSDEIRLGENNFKILGTLTKDEISFDASEVVDSAEIDIEQYDGILVATPRFWDYEFKSFDCSSSNESFRSALPEEIYFENPLGERNPMNQWVGEISHESIKWQTAQENITQKLLIL